MPAATVFHIDAPIAADAAAIELTGPEAHHAATVRRMAVGEPLVLADGSGRIAAGVVSAVGKDRLSVAVSSVSEVPEPAVRVVVAQALPKHERSELAVELATEAGADGFIPWQAERCVARWAGPKQAKGVAKWENAARAAAKQARRPRIPPVAAPASSSEQADAVRAADLALILHESAQTPLAGVELPAAGEIVLIVGPEGGVSDAELALLQNAGAVPVLLGPQVLRTSTAAAVALGALGVLTSRWGGPPLS
jgi:16S rRNA (uracil1498-N3)-methyltransferase